MDSTELPPQNSEHHNTPLYVVFNTTFTEYAEYLPEFCIIQFGSPAAKISPEALHSVAHHELTHAWYDRLSANIQSHIIDTFKTSVPDEIEDYYNLLRTAYPLEYFTLRKAKHMLNMKRQNNRPPRHICIHELKSRNPETIDLSIVIDELLAYAQCTPQPIETHLHIPHDLVLHAKAILHNNPKLIDVVNSLGHDRLDPKPVLDALNSIPDFLLRRLRYQPQIPTSE